MEAVRKATLFSGTIEHVHQNYIVSAGGHSCPVMAVVNSLGAAQRALPSHGAASVSWREQDIGLGTNRLYYVLSVRGRLNPPNHPTLINLRDYGRRSERPNGLPTCVPAPLVGRASRCTNPGIAPPGSSQPLGLSAGTALLRSIPPRTPSRIRYRSIASSVNGVTRA